MKVSQRDIILIKFLFSDLTGAKVRPALMVSNDSYNSANSDAVVLAITSNLSTSEYKVFIENRDLESGTMPVKSPVRVDKPFSVLQGKVLKVKAKVGAKFEEVKAAVKKLIE